MDGLFKLSLVINGVIDLIICLFVICVWDLNLGGGEKLLGVKVVE